MIISVLASGVDVSGYAIFHNLLYYKHSSCSVLFDTFRLIDVLSCLTVLPYYMTCVTQCEMLIVHGTCCL